MANLVPYRSQEIASIVEVTQAAQRELGRIHSATAQEAIYTLTYTRERIQTAAANGMSETKVDALVEQQKEYLRTVQRIVNHSATGLQAVVSNLPALPGPGSSR